jgi:hypothetical protein
MTLYARVISHDPNNIFQQPGFLLNPIFFVKTTLTHHTGKQEQEEYLDKTKGDKKKKKKNIRDNDMRNKLDR